jgi:aspartyl-tRNA(Asn)/glutamyl-tRNA(Gln) amidotransferase subunit A
VSAKKFLEFTDDFVDAKPIGIDVTRLPKPGEYRQSRRKFIKRTLAGAAGALMVSIDKQMARAHDKLDLTQLDLNEISQLLRSKKISPVQLTLECLDRIQRLNGKLNAFITVTADSAMAEARAAESEIQRGHWRGPLHGVPIALKDIVDTAGVRTTAASELFKDRIPTEDAEVVRRLKAAGAVFMGKTNLHEFAYGGSSVVSYFGPARNPWDPACSTGGSSGGSAAAVAARLCYAAIGTDTGGSIRQPASYCGIVGLKPTYGRVSTSGVIPLSWSLDHVGPIARTTKDTALMLQAIAGYDRQDPASSDAPVPDYTEKISASTSSLRLGIPRAYFWEELDPEINTALETALAVLKKLTASQRDIAPLATDGSYSSWTGPYGAVFTAEAYAYHKDYIEKSPQLYHAATLKRLRIGSDVTAAKYIQSRRAMEQLRRSIVRIFENVDVLITPTVRIPPFTIAELQADLDSGRAKELAMLHNTRALNLTGLPTISVPCGFTSRGLPLGMQITGRFGDEATILRLAYVYEQATDWHKREPALG